MEEATLSAWDRELLAWRDKLGAQPVPPALVEELEAARMELETLRMRPEPVSGERVQRHLRRLRDLWQIVAGYDGVESWTTPA